MRMSRLATMGLLALAAYHSGRRDGEHSGFIRGVLHSARVQLETIAAAGAQDGAR